MATIKLIVLAVVLIGFVFFALSIKSIFKRRKPNCDESDLGYSCGCGGGENCSSKTAANGI